MSALGTVFRRELGVYFRTPSGWILAALVVGLDALQLNGVAMGNERRPSAHVLEIFLLNAAFLTQAAAAVLATRLQLDPREAPLWLSAPVRARDLVLGRFGAAFVWLTLITLASLPLPALIYVHGHVSFAHVLVGYAGLLLVAASSLGVASAVATLTRRPLSAVLATAGVLAALELGYYVATTTSPPWRDWLRDLAPVWGRHQSFRRGLLSTADLATFVVMAALGLTLATRLLARRRESP